jgi:hypothetical protein
MEYTCLKLFYCISVSVKLQLHRTVGCESYFTFDSLLLLLNGLFN